MTLPITLEALLNGLAGPIPPTLGSLAVRSLDLDSRQVKPGSVFFALPGGELDGAAFAPQALERGALAVVAERPLPGVAPLLVAAQPRRALAAAAARFFGHPDRRLGLVGVTGTNGKTTTALLVASVAAAAGELPGFIGTLGARLGDRWVEGSLTTPEAPEVCALLAEMVDRRVAHCAMEVSSHALALERVGALRFAAAGFTQLTRDHLDFHGDLESYFQAKARLFRERLAPGASAIVNGDDPFGSRLAAELRAAGRPVQTFGRSPSADLRIVGEQLLLSGSHFSLERAEGRLAISSPLIGAHNTENLALAAGLSLAVGFSSAAVEAGLAALATVPGRLERVVLAGRPAPLGFVDYAHTDDALARVLATLRTVGGGPPRRLWAVFGCGGDRDPGKRPLMGRAAALGADVVVATSDNPRREDPASILAQVEVGLRAGGMLPSPPETLAAGQRGFAVEPDRRAAIALAVALAAPDDVVLIAGKGHELRQIVGEVALPFDDRVELRLALARRAG